MKNDYPIRNNLEVSTSGFYRWQQESPLWAHALHKTKHSPSKFTKSMPRAGRLTGSPHILMGLRKIGRYHGRNQIAGLMRQQGLPQKRRYSPSHHR